MITRKQLALVHLAKAQLNMEDGLYRAVLHHHGGGVATARDLDFPGFEGVMAYFAAAASARTGRSAPSATGRAWPRRRRWT